MRKTSIAKAKIALKEHIITDIATDKSISHRAVMFALLAKGKCEISHFLMGEDTLHTLEIAKALGLEVEQKGNVLVLTPPDSIKEPSVVLDCGNAGTGMRLYAGLLSGIKGHFVLSGDKYLNARPMARITKPLNDIGAKIIGRDNNKYAPLSITGQNLAPFCYTSPIASAQVKSAMILAGLQSEGKSVFIEPSISRNHTENMLKTMGADIATKMLESGGYEVSVSGLKDKLESFKLDIPADPSSAFYFAVLACVLEIKVVLKRVLLNQTRIEAFKVLESMGAHITYNQTSSDYESVGDIIIEGRGLKAIKLESNIAWLIDEIPALAICFACANGVSEVRNAKELRVKESDRIVATISNLRAMGIECEEYDDGFSVKGGEVKSARIESYGDHRIALSFAILLLKCGGEIMDSGCIDVSFPNFLDILCQFSDISNTKE